MGRKRRYEFGDDSLAGEHIPQVRSRRGRQVKKSKLKSDDDDFEMHSSEDSGPWCEEHYSPTVAGEAQRYLPVHLLFPFAFPHTPSLKLANVD
jgi:hypothetical protein